MQFSNEFTFQYSDPTYSEYVPRGQTPVYSLNWALLTMECSFTKHIISIRFVGTKNSSSRCPYDEENVIEDSWAFIFEKKISMIGTVNWIRRQLKSIFFPVCSLADCVHPPLVCLIFRALYLFGKNGLRLETEYFFHNKGSNPAKVKNKKTPNQLV